MQELKKLQASFVLLALKVKNLHWNINEAFFPIHEELDKVYDDVNELGDAFAEKVVMFDELALGSYNEMAKESLVHEISAKWFSLSEIKNELVSDFSKLINYINEVRENYGAMFQPLFDDATDKLVMWRWKVKHA